ncbi:MAG: M20/M25/M40 family metallo-hydrolase [Candidatus Woesearchaeota archaeon]
MKDKLRKTFLELVSISEVYPNEDKIIGYIERRLADSGIAFKRDSFNNIIAWVEGSGRSILLNTHMDIPEPNPKLSVISQGDIISSDGNTILGADPKSGLAVLIEFLIKIKESKDNHHTVEAVITRGEEAGLIGATNLDYSLIKSKRGLVLDEDGPVSRVIIKAPCVIKLDIEIRGKKGHPRNPKEGKNVLPALEEILYKIPPGYSKEGLTWNIGLISAGSARNTIPGELNIAAELRSYSKEDIESGYKRIHKQFKDSCSNRGLSLKIQITQRYYGYSISNDSELINDMRKTYKKMDIMPGFYSTFGGSDANIFNNKGIQTVPIGSAYYNAHQHQEYVRMDDMQNIMKFLELFYAF